MKFRVGRAYRKTTIPSGRASTDHVPVFRPFRPSTSRGEAAI
jgi:hypothetical protein